ncbi:MAG: ArnT family glycosyltransferase [Candidatus Helarchaeota archaeon]
MFSNEKDRREFIFFVVVIIIINFLSIINYYNGFFISDEINFIIYQKEWRNMFTDFSLIYYRPIPMSIVGGLYLLFGLNPIPFHILTVIMNTLNTILFLIISRKLFINPLVGYIAIIIFMGFYGICFEVILWIAVYFDLFFIFFTLCGFIFFIKYIQEENRKNLNFIITGLFINIAYLCKETAMFVLPIFIFFDLLKENFDIKNFVKGIWKYIIFIPMPAIFLINRLHAANSSLYTIWNYLAMGIFAIIIIPLLNKLRKIDDHNTRFTYLLLYFSCFPLLIAPTSRIWYFTALGLSLFISLSLVNESKYSFFDLLKRIKRINYTKKRKIGLALLIYFMSSSLTLYIFANVSYSWASISTYNITRTLASTNLNGKNVYIVNVPYNPLVWGMHEDHVQLSYYMVTGKSLELKYVIIDDQNKYLYQGHLATGAELISIEDYNNLTQNSSNLMFLYDLSLLNIRNVSFKNYGSW